MNKSKLFKLGIIFAILLLISGIYISIGFVEKLSSTPKTEIWGRILKILFGLIVILLALYLFYLGF